MKKFFVILTLCAFGLSANASSLLSTSIEANPKVDDAKVTAAAASIFTAYGNAVITYYPSGNVKKIRCKKPKDTICFTVESMTHEHNIYDSGSLVPTHTFVNSVYTIGSTSGDTTIEY